jgi:hypothetical protein
VAHSMRRSSRRSRRRHGWRCQCRRIEGAAAAAKEVCTRCPAWPSRASLARWCACLDGVSMARDGRGCGAAHGQKALDAGARCVGAAGGAREQRTRGGCRPQPSHRLEGGGAGHRGGGGSPCSWRHQVRCDARVSGRVSTSRDASAATLDVESGTR